MDAFALVAKITLDSSEYDKNLDKTKNSLSSVATTIGGGLATAAKVGTAAIGAAATAVGVLAKKSVDGYAQQEQMVGGVKKLYGNMGQSLEEYAASMGKTTDEVKTDWQNLEKAQNMVLDNAKKAYKTAGMSANQYMEMSTSFSASLISSLNGDTVKAAEQTDVAMKAISDNWNTFGGDIGRIQDAYQGFAKQNFTMLDNLKLGYGGTKTEMERLISDANQYAESIGKAGDLSVDSFSDIVTAIELIQEKQNIAGTTEREMATTIEGSLNAARAAWDNLLTGFADPKADIGELVGDVVDTATVAFENLLPAVEQALIGIGDFVSNIVPIIAEKLPELIEQLLPPLIEASISLVSGLVQALPQILEGLVNAVPTIFETLKSAISDQMDSASLSDIGTGLVDSIASGFDTTESLIEKGSEIIAGFIDTVMDKLPDVIESGTEIINALVEGIFQLRSSLIDAGEEALMEFVDGITDALPELISSAGSIINTFYSGFLDNLPKLAEAGINVLMKLVEGIEGNLPQIGTAAVQVIGQFITTFLTHLPQLIQTGMTIDAKLVAGIIKAIPQIIAALPQILSAIVSWFASQDWASIGTNIVRGIAGGISSSAGMIVSAAREAALSALNAAKSALGIASPSKEGKKLGKWLVKGIAKGIRDSENEAAQAAQEAANKTLQAARQRLENYKVYRNVDLQAEATYWNKVRKMLKKGTQARIDADKEYFNAKKTLKQAKKDAKANAKEIATEYKNSYKKVNDELAKDIKKVNDDLNEDLEKNNKEWLEDREKAIADAAKDINKIWDDVEKQIKKQGESIAHSLNLFEGVKFDDKVSKKNLLVNLDEQVTALEEWDMTLDQLGRRIGTDSELFQELAEMGVSALPTLREINDMSNAELNQYMALFEQKNAIAQERAQENSEILRKQAAEEQAAREAELAQELADLDAAHETYQAERRAEAQKTINELKAEAAQEIKELTAQYKKDLKELAKSLKGQGKPVGKAMIQGITEGLKGSQKILTAASQKAAKEALKAAKKTLGIKSPSKEFAEVGKMIDYGMAEGITGNINKVETAMGKLTGATTGSVDVSSTTAGNTMSNNINMNIYGAVGQDVKELAEIVEQRITQSIGVQMRGMAYA